MHREYKRRKIIIFSLIGILLLMAVGYSAFQTKLNITSTSNITSVWDVEITNIQTKEINGLAENVYDPTYTKLEANMEANFYEPGDYITYIVTVSNLGTLDATLDSIKLNMPQEDVINFKVEGATSKEKLKVGEHKDIEVTMEYTGNNPDNISSVEMDVNLDYVQDGNSTNFSDADSPVVDNLRINDIILTPDEESVKAEIEAENAIKYYFSIDNNEWYESTSNIYNIYHLKPNTTYTMYVKAEGSNGDVVYSSKPFTTLDNTSPEINIKVGDNVKGENDWYKGLSLNIEVTDNDKVKEVLYCTEKDCTPDKVLNLEDNQTTITFESKSDIQEVCIKATDMKGNVSNKCSSEYKVDGTEPTISNMNINTLDDTMTIELTATDNESGLYKYYFSKDGGKTYIESNNPNYTFTSLDEGDYLVTAYVKDTAGNESEIQAKSTAIRYTSYCKKNGIDNFGECLIATEAQNPNIDEAKNFIKSKGTPDFSKTSPSILYDEIKSSQINTYTTASRITVSDSYTFHKETGIFKLTSFSLKNPDEINLNDGKTYYSCGLNSSGCSTLHEIVSVNTTTDNEGAKTFEINKYDHYYRVSNYDSSDTGMYMDNDNNGESYYYRGTVASNYVKFAGLYWRVIRINGDGTVRMIYDGTSPHANGESSTDRQIGKSVYNAYDTDNMYSGYMYGNNENGVITESPSVVDTTWGKSLSSSTKYVFGSEYTYDKKTNSFKVSGNKIKSTIKEYQDIYNNPGYYTCFEADEDMSCNKLFHAIRRSDDSSMIVKYVEYSTTSYNQANENINDSEVKKYLDNWYKNNMTSYENKLSKSSYFCNDRSLSSASANGYNNLGFGQNPTIYKAHDRIGGFATDSTYIGVYNPSLICPQSNDKFTVDAVNGNGKLKYPVGLITADELLMAGAGLIKTNVLFYLYIGNSYFTMTPSYFRQITGNMNLYRTDWNGGLDKYTGASGSSKYGVRPVINLDPDKITFTGNGTMQDPYVIS